MSQTNADESTHVDVAPTTAEKFGAWFDLWAPRLGWAAVGALIVGPIAWWGGAWVGCSRSKAGCEYRADSVEALGTWFGAVGTVAAVLAAVYAFRSEERARKQSERKESLKQRAVERRYAREAQGVTISTGGTTTAGAIVLDYEIIVTNGADQTTLYGLRGHDPTGSLRSEHSLGPAGTSRTRRNRRDGRGSEPDLPLPDMMAWVVERTTIKFRMNERYWSRTGNARTELIDRFEYDGEFDDE